ncbi:MAG: hypothetical protein AAFR20_05755 [Pseudomonadota bacterium]
MKQTRRNTLILTTATLLMAGGLSAFAQETGTDDKSARKDRATRMIERFDTNGDGAVDQFEVDENHAKRFESIDANSDGFLTRAEARDAADQRLAERRAKMDERRAERRARYDAMSEEERAALKEKRKRRGKKARRGRGGKGRGFDADRMFDRADQNQDGEVSRAEFDATRKDRIMRADQNADGRVTAEELKAFAKERRKDRRGGSRGRGSRGS